MQKFHWNYLTFANRFRVEDLETETQKSFEWIGANNVLMGDLGRKIIVKNGGW